MPEALSALRYRSLAMYVTGLSTASRSRPVTFTAIPGAILWSGKS
jgi:hypothetical protein